MDRLHFYIITMYITWMRLLIIKSDISICYHLLIPLKIDNVNICYKLKEEFREELNQNFHIIFA